MTKKKVTIENIEQPEGERATKILKERRIIVIYDELCKGQPSSNVVGRIKAEWGLKDAQAWDYVSEALTRIKQSYEKFADKAAETLFESYLYLYREQTKANEKAEARKTLDSMCRLLGVNKEQPVGNNERPQTIIINTSPSNGNTEASTSTKQA